MVFFFCGYCIVYGVWTFSVGGWVDQLDAFGEQGE